MRQRSSLKQFQEGETTIVEDAKTQQQIADIGKQLGVIFPDGTKLRMVGDALSGTT
jgi:hypothetical protein